MLTLHRADLVLLDADRSLPGGAVVVRDDRIADVGPYQELAAAHRTARVRNWHGVLMPGLRNPCGRRLLEHAYHPDPREAAELGTEPVTGAALAALAMDDARWGASARRGLQRMLRHGTTAVSGPFEHPAVRTAVARSGLTVLPEAEGAPPADRGRPTLNPLLCGPQEAPHALRAVLHGSVVPGARADLAVFEISADDDLWAALRAPGAAGCTATVLAGRLVHRRA